MSETTTKDYTALSFQDLICLTVCGKTDEIAKAAWKAIKEKGHEETSPDHLTLPARFGRTSEIQSEAKNAVHDHPATTGSALALLAWTEDPSEAADQLRVLLKESKDPQVADLF